MRSGPTEYNQQKLRDTIGALNPPYSSPEPRTTGPGEPGPAAHDHHPSAAWDDLPENVKQLIMQTNFRKAELHKLFVELQLELKNPRLTPEQRYEYARTIHVGFRDEIEPNWKRINQWRKHGILPVNGEALPLEKKPLTVWQQQAVHRLYKVIPPLVSKAKKAGKIEKVQALLEERDQLQTALGL